MDALSTPQAGAAFRSRAFEAIRSLVASGRPLIYIQSPEEDRVVNLLQHLAEQTGGAFFMWSLTEGLSETGRTGKTQPEDARSVLDRIIEQRRPGVFLLKDFHEAIRESPVVRRRLRDLYYACLNSGKFVVIASPVKVIPEEISREVAFLDLPRPDLPELEELLRSEVSAMRAAGRKVELSEPSVYVLCRALQGLTFNEARHALRRAAAESGILDGSAVPQLQEEKRVVVRRAGLIEYVPETTGIDAIGGVEVLKNWLLQRRKLFFSRESLSAEIVPKGVLLMGVSGCGKSLSARAIANVFELPLYRIDMVRVFAAGLANAERLFSEACHSMEEVAPAVVWFDEIENGISRHPNDTTGVLDRIFGFFLTWMQEKPPGLFVAATANRIDLLPAEMIRKGRFDQVFFIDLPDKIERREIFEIHLRKRGVDPATLSMDLIAERTDGWTGAEIEQAVISALIAARIDGEPLTDKYMLPALRQIVPLSRTMKEQVGHIRSWAFDRAVHASQRRK